MTQAEFGSLVGADQTVISEWETGKRKRPPDRPTVEALEAALEIEDGHLLGAAGYAIHRSQSASTRAGREVIADGLVGEATSLSYGGVPLSADQEREILAYIEFVRNRDDSDGA